MVANKFDNYAPTFEEHLVQNLKYCAPQEIARAASERITSQRGGQMYASALDAGCGTGLAGPLLRELVSGPLVGVDLSPKMAELADGWARSNSGESDATMFRDREDGSGFRCS